MNAFSSYPGDDEVTWARKKLLRDVPHCLLGRIAGAHNITVHVLFPHLQLVGETERFISLTEQQLTRWTDEVFHPALWRVLPAHYTQHLPPTYRVALANSKANQVEARKVESSSYQAQQAITYHLQSGYLHEIWEAVSRHCRPHSRPGRLPRTSTLYYSERNEARIPKSVVSADVAGCYRKLGVVSQCHFRHALR